MRTERLDGESSFRNKHLAVVRIVTICGVSHPDLQLARLATDGQLVAARLVRPPSLVRNRTTTPDVACAETAPLDWLAPTISVRTRPCSIRYNRRNRSHVYAVLFEEPTMTRAGGPGVKINGNSPALKRRLLLSFVSVERENVARRGLRRRITCPQQ